ncbi:TPA: enoyl-ACP reductase [Candidatus Galligastranaerophilus intestinigallinarum]|nr:enoyl-ACP reductase [Candidatus Galligastranaerophilus intestinigallinarum]
MGIMDGKKGIIFGVSNKFGIANAIAEQIYKEGGEIAFTYANEAMEKRVRPIADSMNAKLCLECDVTKDEDVKKVFEEYAKTYDRLDFVIHAVAFANKEDLMGDFYTTSREGWDLAMHVSAYSLLTMSKYAKPQMELTGGGSILALTYLGSTKAVANYNIMGVAKAALESSMRFIAADLGKYNIRCNCLSAGPVKTMAAKGIGGFDRMLKANILKAPLKRTPSLEDVGKAGLYLASDLSSGVTGEVHFVDCGAHSVFASLD